MQRKSTAVAMAALLATLGLAIINSPTPAWAAPTVTVLGPNVTLKVGDPVPAGEPSATVTLARNEFESFQMVVEAEATINDLEVEVAEPLRSFSGATLPTDAVTFYREAYYAVQATAGSDNRSDGESSVGQWPDALIPQKDYVYGEQRAGFSTPVGAGGRAVLWVDVLAGQGQAPGTYTGTIRVKDSADELTTVPISVEVRNFTLPSTSTLQSVFPMYPGDQCKAHSGGNATCNGDVAKANRLAALYERVALENRLTISTPWAVDMGAALGNHAASWRTLVRPIVNGTTADPSLGTPIRLAGARATNLNLWWWCEAACIEAWKTEATNGGFPNRLVYYTCDEPNQSSTKWDTCNSRHDVAAPSGLRELVTAPLTFAENEGGGAESWIDDMVVLIRFMAGKDATWSGNHRPTYNTWGGQDGDGQPNRVWLYSSCESAGCDGPDNSATWSAPTYSGWPGFGIDQPASQARAMSWLAYLYDAAGELYWETGYRLDKAWNACTNVSGADDPNCLYYAGMGGDGTLFYPGLACPPGTGAGCIGGTKDIPVESMRLKRIRDGREDYEYLHLLNSDPDPASRQIARDTALTLFGGDLDSATYSATFSQTALDTARDTLGDALDEPVDPGEPELSISDATATEGTGGETIMSFTVTGSGDGYGYVDIEAESGTAATDDYALQTTSLEMGTHDTRQVRVMISSDSVDEPDETFSVRLVNNTNIGLGDALGVGTIVDDDQTPGPTKRFRPDGLVRTGSGAYQGNNVYNTTGANQTASVKARRGVTKTFYVRIANDGNTRDNWSVAEARVGTGGFARSWFLDTRNVTTAVSGGTLSFLGVAPGGSRILRFTTRPTTAARIGQVATWSLHGVHNPLADRIRDVVQIRVTVVR